MISSAYVLTETPSKYINRLCKHFSHKVPVIYDENEGNINFSIGKGLISKTANGLLLQAIANTPEELTEVIDIMDRHFVRVAWQEELTLQWERLDE